MKNIVLCNHTGSFNRGCDAIIKSTADIFSTYDIDVILGEHRFNEDKGYGLSEFSGVVEYSEFNNAPFLRAWSLILGKIFKREYLSAFYRQKKIWKSLDNSVGFNVGGDTYCYERCDRLPSMMLNKYCFENQKPLIFWGCSIEKEIICDQETLTDLKKYTYVCPRESITRDNLIAAGLDPKKVLFMADPAFTLKKEVVELPADLIVKNTVGINLSPLVLDKSCSSEVLMKNYCNLIHWILENTDMSIALIPHVYKANDESFGDLSALGKIKAKFTDERRVFIIKDFYNAKQLKYIISQFRFLVTARTHASIAAYSSFVPTLVIGYSVKAKGIALDLFGTAENYIRSVQKIQNDDDIKNSFEWIYKNERRIIHDLKVSVPKCIDRINKTAQRIIIDLLK